jgi:HK97 family phage prohead protease
VKAIYSIPQELKASIKDVDGKKGIVTGYFASFNNVDSDGDIIIPGAFLKSIAESGPNSAKPRVKHLLNHDVRQPLGEIQVLKEDLKGLYYESQTGSHNLGVDFVKMVDSGLITEHSIGYETMKWRNHDTATYSMYGKDYPVRELQELKLWEGSSLTAWGANSETPLTGLKSMTNEQILARIPLLKSAIKNGTFTDATFDILIAELSAIEQAYKALTETTQPGGNDRTTEPSGSELIDAIKSFSIQLN